MKNSIPLQKISVQIRKFEKNTIDSVVAIGRLLREAKEQCEHGEYQEWLKREFAWSYRTALRYGHAYDLQKCHGYTFETLDLSLGAMHIAADPSTSDDESMAIIEAARLGRVTTAIAKGIVYALRNPAEQTENPVEPDDPLEPADEPAEPDEPDEPEEDTKSTPERLQGSVRLHAEASGEFASGFTDQDIEFLVSKPTCNGDAEVVVAAARRAEATWGALAARIEKAAGLKDEDVTPGRSALKAKADRAEARSRAVAI